MADLAFSQRVSREGVYGSCLIVIVLCIIDLFFLKGVKRISMGALRKETKTNEAQSQR